MFVCVFGRLQGVLAFYARVLGSIPVGSSGFLDLIFLNNVCIDTLCLICLFKNAVA